MEIQLQAIKVCDLIDGFVNDPDNGVRGYSGRLDIRPPYQREFRYDLKQKQAVVNTILKGFPLNIMYWSVVNENEFEMIDGQQRTLSICEFYNHDFNIVDKDRGKLYYQSLTADEKEDFLNYELTVYFCTGTDKEKLDWFRVINIAGERLLDQELLNAIHVGPFVCDARRYFSKDNCPAYKIASDLLSGVAREQAYLETVLKWISRRDGVNDIGDYMSQHKDDPNANKLWEYFSAIVTWVRSTFIEYRKEMKGIDWGMLYDKYHENIYDTAELEKRIHDLMEDDEIPKKAGIYSYVLSGDLRDLTFRTFDKKQKREAYERQNGICPHCGKHFELDEMEGDHITPWAEGGITTADNCQMLCKECNRRKGCK
ncbi:MAG: DUF262 domain-containing protein [Bacteroidales bacterium]|nr:DUF262 domain-containing protein [Bacteroidales bacterium]